jgi:hypothetical protein
MPPHRSRPARRTAATASAALAASVVALPAALAAQDPAPPPGASTPVILGDARWSPSFGVHAGLPTVLAAQVGIARLRERKRGDEAGPFVGLEAGIGGFKGGLGLMARGDVGALVVQAAALRTTGSAWLAADRATYAGLEARAMVLLVTFGLGAYARTDGGDARRVIPTAYLGVSY